MPKDGRCRSVRVAVCVPVNVPSPSAPASAVVTPPPPFPVTKSSASNLCGTSRTTHRPASLPNNGPATITVGIATATPSASVMPRSAPSRSIAVSGPGCGGTSPCMADSPARAGIPTVTSDSCDRLATR